MKRVESTEIDGSLPIAELQSVLGEYPVQFAILFGSRAFGNAHRTSDVDVAVEFESIEREDPAYNEMFFGLSSDLSDVLESDDVDLVDVQTFSPSIGKAVLERGVVLAGDSERAEVLLERIAASSSEEPSPRERFDAALGRIDDHLGGDSGVPATEGSRGER